MGSSNGFWRRRARRKISIHSSPSLPARLSTKFLSSPLVSQRAIFDMTRSFRLVLEGRHHGSHSEEGPRQLRRFSPRLLRFWGNFESERIIPYSVQRARTSAYPQAPP